LNIYSLFVTTPMLFFYFWPLYRPVTAENMYVWFQQLYNRGAQHAFHPLLSTNKIWNRNWSSTMFGGVLIVAALYYLFKGRHEYVGPVTFVKREEWRETHM
jgi:hypothetical protein